MSGHNKWSKIKHQKAASDATKSKVFGKLVRFITVEAKKANGDTNAPGLRVALEKARAANMPLDTVERAIAKATSDASASMERVVYEAYGPGGVAVVIDALTDNRNRTAAELKHLLSKHGVALAAPGSASWAFKKEGGAFVATTTTPLSDAEGQALMALVAALEDNDDVQDVYTNAA